MATFHYVIAMLAALLAGFCAVAQFDGWGMYFAINIVTCCINIILGVTSDA